MGVVVDSVKKFQWRLSSDAEHINIDHVPISLEHKGMMINVCNVVDPHDKRTGLGNDPLMRLDVDALNAYNQQILAGLANATARTFGEPFSVDSLNQLTKDISTAELRQLDMALAQAIDQKQPNAELLKQFPINFIYEFMTSEAYKDLSEKAYQQRVLNGENLALTNQDVSKLSIPDSKGRTKWAQVEGLRCQEGDVLHNLQVVRLFLWNVLKTKKVDENTPDDKIQTIALTNMLNDLLTPLGCQPAGGYALDDALQKALIEGNKEQVLSQIAKSQIDYCARYWDQQNPKNLPCATFVIESHNRKEPYARLDAVPREVMRKSVLPSSTREKTAEVENEKPNDKRPKP